MLKIALNMFITGRHFVTAVSMETDITHWDWVRKVSQKNLNVLSARHRRMGPVCLCTSYMRTQDTLSCLE